MTLEKPPLRFTVQERILLHLQEYCHFSHQIEVPEQLTQQGTAECIRVQRKHLPRALKQLLEKEYITERRTHVTGKNQRMKTYSLTQRGKNQAQHLQEHIYTMQFPVRQQKGAIVFKTMDEIITSSPTHFSVAEIISMITTDGLIDLSQRQQQMTHSHQVNKDDRISIYRQALIQAWRDGKMTNDERELLVTLRKSLGITEKEHMQIEADILYEFEHTKDKHIREVYRVALEQALADQKISPDEKAILEEIKKRFRLKDIDTNM